MVVADGFSYLESPRWHDGALWLSDFYTHQVVTVSGDGTVSTVVEVPGQPSGLGWLPDGRLLVVSMHDRKLMRVDDGRLVEHANLSQLADWHLNDIVVDDQGRAYVGNIGFDVHAGKPIKSTNLIRVDPDGSATIVAEDLVVPNGTVMTDDCRTLIVAQTFGQELTAFDVEPDGSLSNRRAWARFGEPAESDDLMTVLGGLRLAPDGICLDAEGLIWAADALGHRVVRVREGGEILEEISTGDDAVFACMLGGADGTTLFLCIAPSFNEQERTATREAKVLSCPVSVGRAGRP
ncbi:SMP-30/gluconolactonase/LRE family protein [Sporichthya sp.]|uniref:SMP-30/gluconolactonase/LRE family protein n=1 Tax=Sporichthya sp. TaxID=65475 RepID=UPI0017C2042D|nr:SMP-30/gluconolactonase/LRE family protein [Sporichthya sp.]MBA3741351.1 SMP-30/gluconolactonase/LRE family protein [Sporichthya sp.]